jgi:hypothetical protein
MLPADIAVGKPMKNFGQSNTSQYQACMRIACAQLPASRFACSMTPSTSF